VKAGIQSCTLEVERDSRRFTLVIEKVTRIRDVTAKREWEGELTPTECEEAKSALDLFGLGRPGPGIQSCTLRVKREDRSVHLLIEQSPLWIYDTRTNRPWEGALSDKERARVVARLARAEP
jgi:hypothetical protein